MGMLQMSVMHGFLRGKLLETSEASMYPASQRTETPPILERVFVRELLRLEKLNLRLLIQVLLRCAKVTAAQF